MKLDCKNKNEITFKYRAPEKYFTIIRKHQFMKAFTARIN